MKQVIKSIVLATVVTVSVITLSSFIAKKTAVNSTTADAYVISLESKEVVGTNWVWTWKLTNPNPGNGDNGTLQNVSHWSVPLSLDAENALISAEYSFDGVNWTSTSAVLDRDPSIRACTTVDVLKYDVGTAGTAPTYYRATFNQDFVINPFAKSWIKTGGGLQGCNLYYFSGTGTRLD
jgi:hypothetical protein